MAIASVQSRSDGIVCYMIYSTCGVDLRQTEELYKLSAINWEVSKQMNTTVSPALAVLSWPIAKLDPVLERLQPPGMPLLFEDEGLEMGESTLHSLTCGILF